MERFNVLESVVYNLFEGGIQDAIEVLKEYGFEETSRGTFFRSTREASLSIDEEFELGENRVFYKAVGIYSEGRVNFTEYVTIDSIEDLEFLKKILLEVQDFYFNNYPTIVDKFRVLEYFGKKRSTSNEASTNTGQNRFTEDVLGKLEYEGGYITIRGRYYPRPLYIITVNEYPRGIYYQELHFYDILDIRDLLRTRFLDTWWFE